MQQLLIQSQRKFVFYFRLAIINILLCRHFDNNSVRLFNQQLFQIELLLLFQQGTIHISAICIYKAFLFLLYATSKQSWIYVLYFITITLHYAITIVCIYIILYYILSYYIILYYVILYILYIIMYNMCILHSSFVR